MKSETKKLPKSQMEIEFQLTEQEFQTYIDRALEHLKKHVKADGFRPGQAPAKIVQERVGKETLLVEAGDHAVKDIYSKYVVENNLEPVGQPEVQIMKIAQGSPFVFKAKITLLPDVELPDYKEIAKLIKPGEISVSEEELEDAVNYLRRAKAKFTAKIESAENKDFVEITYQNKDINAGKEVDDGFVLGEGGFMKGFEENILGMKSGEEKSFKAVFPQNSPRKDLAGKEGDFTVKVKSVQKMELPESGDEFAKQMGAFNTLVALKSSIKEGIMAEKQDAEKQKRREEILEKVSEKTKLDMPDAIVEYEKERLLEDFKKRVAQNVKISWEEYLASIKKTEKELAQAYQKEAEKRIRNFLVLREIGKKEGVLVDEKEVDEEVNKSIKNLSKQELDKVDIEQLKEYTKGVLYNEKVFNKLENN